MQQFQCPRCGSLVYYGIPNCASCGQPLSWQPQPSMTPVAPYAQYISPKSRLAVTLLAWFVGVFGIHRFYVGKVGTGLIQLFTFGGLGIWAFIDFILAVIGDFKDNNNLPIKKW